MTFDGELYLLVITFHFLPCDGWFRFANTSTFECDFGTILRLPDDRSLRKCRFDIVFRHGRFVACSINPRVSIFYNNFKKICSCFYIDVLFKMFSFSSVYKLNTSTSFGGVNRGMYKKNRYDIRIDT